MPTGKTAYLLVGPRAAGKSTYCEKLAKIQKGLVIVSRDRIMIEQFGSDHSSGYGGEHAGAYEIMWGMVHRELAKTDDAVLVLDSWTGRSAERRMITEKLRAYGAGRIVALFFVTPLKYVNKWFWEKPGIARIGEMRVKRSEDGWVFYCDDAPARDYDLFYELAAGIESDGFDGIIYVNPLQEFLPFK